MIGLLSKLTWDDVKGPLLFLSGMIVGVILVAIIWYLVHIRKAHAKRQLDPKSTESHQGESEAEGEVVDVDGDDGRNYPSAIIVQGAEGDYLFEDKSQLGGIIDFKNVPRRDIDRQTARRELVITMLIAESMSK